MKLICYCGKPLDTIVRTAHGSVEPRHAARIRRWPGPSWQGGSRYAQREAVHRPADGSMPDRLETKWRWTCRRCRKPRVLTADKLAEAYDERAAAGETEILLGIHV